jgi:DNA-binding CsgD family transcriptional regulator
MPPPQLIGRADELDAIAAAWTQLVETPGRGPVVALVTGEAGSGKSRLVAEVLPRLAPVPAEVLAGSARTYAPAPYDWFASALSGRPVDDLPVSGALLDWLLQRSDAPPQRLAPAAMLRAAVDVVRGLLAGRPGVLVIEDLHDLDPASLTLVADLAGHAGLPALLLVTSRAPHEAAFPPVAARTLRRLTGTAGLVRAHLAPFNLRETADLLEACFDAVPAPDTVRAVHTRTGGNPFWLTELIAEHGGGTDHGDASRLAAGPLPAHLAALLVDRLAGEPALVGQVARAAALLGEDVATPELTEVCGDGTEAALRRLVDLGLLVVTPHGPLRMTHPLVREALAAAALPAERTSVYRQGYDLATAYGDDAALARYAMALGRRTDAASAAARAAAGQLAEGRPDAALATVALGLGASSTADAGRLLPVGVTAARVTGQTRLGIEYAARWLDLLDADRDPLAAAEAHRQLAALRWYAGGTASAADQERHLASAQALVDRASGAGLDGADRDRARQDAAVAEALLRAGDPVGAATYAEKARQATPGDERATASGTVTLGVALDRLGEHDRSVALLRAGRQLAEDAGDLVTLGRAVHQLVEVSLPRAAITAGWRLVDEAMATVARYGLERAGVKVTIAGYRLARRAGDLARAEALVWTRLPVEPDAPGRAQLAAAAGLLAVERGDDRLAARLLARAEAAAAETTRSCAARSAALLAVAVAARTGRTVEVAFGDYLRLPGPDGLAEAARWALRGGVPAVRLRELTTEALGDLDEAFATQPRALAQLRCLFAAADHADELAVVCGSAALAGTTEEAWQDAELRVALAGALHRLGRLDEAREHAERACALLSRWPGWRRDEAAALRRGLRDGGELAARELTPRELEVLTCIAAGMSNQQVARSLGISIRTVAVHVSNLLRKTGAASRTEAALWAVRHRLAGVDT